jgi:ferrous iron transport protein B
MLRIALVGNPNCGKTSLFNVLTGLKQKVGNFAGVTVDKKLGYFSLPSGEKVQVTDLPGAYSLYPKSLDEQVVHDALLNKASVEAPELVVLVLDASNLKRNLFLASQVIDLGLPAICVLNMTDLAEEKGFQIDLDGLSDAIGIPVVTLNAATGKGVRGLKQAISEGRYTSGKTTIDFSAWLDESEANILPELKNYTRFHALASLPLKTWMSENEKSLLQDEFALKGKSESEWQLWEISERYVWINQVHKSFVHRPRSSEKSALMTKRLDKVLTHKVWGTLIFLGVFFLLFQAVFTVAAYPMDWIDAGMAWLIESIGAALPSGLLNSFITDGILAGLAGVVIFIPQIMILFGLITALEDSGYMSRVSFINDRLLSKVGLNGKSIVPLVGGFACAVPAVMAARSIENVKERLLTIFITPLMSCSARLPVYVFLVAFIVPNERLFGLINLQGLFMLGLYLLGIVMSGLVAWVMNKFIQQNQRSTFVMELPLFKKPSFKNIASSMWAKGRTFVTEAGKVIMVVSMILWVLSSFGPGDTFENIEKKYQDSAYVDGLSEEEISVQVNSEKLRESYAGQMGRLIEPAIEPLGFDWKIGIALITSFAAREVFVGTMSTIYSVEGDEAHSIKELQDKLMNKIDPSTGKAVFSRATALSLVIFYVFAMQCMSTVAIVKKETGGWKWAIAQLIFLTALAYVASLITYQIFA